MFRQELIRLIRDWSCSWSLLLELLMGQVAGWRQWSSSVLQLIPPSLRTDVPAVVDIIDRNVSCGPCLADAAEVAIERRINPCGERNPKPPGSATFGGWRIS